MNTPLSLGSYAEWRHCITHRCGIPLTADYVDARIAALADPRDHGTQRFLQVWGAPCLEQVRRWFEQARRELAGEHGATPS